MKEENEKLRSDVDALNETVEIEDKLLRKILGARHSEIDNSEGGWAGGGGGISDVSVRVGKQRMNLSLFRSPKRDIDEAASTSFQFPEVHLKNLQNKLEYEADASLLITQQNKNDVDDESWMLNASTWTSRGRGDNGEGEAEEEGEVSEAVKIAAAVSELEESLLASLN